MFVHVATLYSVRAETAYKFMRSIRAGGDRHKIARRVAPDLITSDFLQHQSSPSPVFLCIDFWVSKERYTQVRESEVYESLLGLRNQMASAATELGVFTFPNFAESDALPPKAEDPCTRTYQREIQ